MEGFLQAESGQDIEGIALAMVTLEEGQEPVPRLTTLVLIR